MACWTEPESPGQAAVCDNDFSGWPWQPVATTERPPRQCGLRSPPPGLTLRHDADHPNPRILPPFQPGILGAARIDHGAAAAAATTRRHGVCNYACPPANAAAAAALANGQAAEGCQAAARGSGSC